MADCKVRWDESRLPTLKEALPEKVLNPRLDNDPTCKKTWIQDWMERGKE